MHTGTGDYVAYLLRMWREDVDGLHLWRAALQDAQTLEEQHFGTIEALVGFLQAGFADREYGPKNHRKEPDNE